MGTLTTDANGHVTYGGAPGGATYGTPTVGSFQSTWGTSGTGLTAGSTDTAGEIIFTAGTSPAAGNVCTLTFAAPYPTPPKAVIVQGGATDQSAGPLFTVPVSNISAGAFILAGAAGATKSYKVSYFVVPA